MTQMMLTGYDHSLIFVDRLDDIARFYEEVLGMWRVDRDDETLLHFDEHQLVLAPVSSPRALSQLHPTVGSASLCFTVGAPPGQVEAWLRDHQVRILDGPVDRIGATGAIRSVFVHDPEGNLIELACSGE